jgi:tetratricopeptide (TPR) repeat protein
LNRSPAAARSPWPTLVAASLLPLLLRPVPASGQGDDMALAREAYSRGQSLFDAEEYEAALAAFGESLDAFPHSRTIFNIALCHEKLGDVAAAVAMYQRYVDWPAEVPNRDEVRAKVAELKRLLPPEPEPDPEPPGEIAAGPGPSPPPPVEREPGPDLRLPGWVAIGAGAAGLVAGGVLLGLAQKRASEIDGIEGVPYEPATHDALQREGRRSEVAGWIAGGAGIAAVAAGVAMLLFSPSGSTDGAEPGAALAAGFAGPVQGGFALGLEGRF